MSGKVFEEKKDGTEVAVDENSEEWPSEETILNDFVDHSEEEEDFEAMIKYHDEILGDEEAAFETFDPMLFENAVNEYDPKSGASLEDIWDEEFKIDEMAASSGATFDMSKTPGADLDEKAYDGAIEFESHLEGAAHDPEHCENCLEEAQDDLDMSMALSGFAVFVMIFFAMWYMLKSCKDKQEGEGDFNPRNSNSRG